MLLYYITDRLQFSANESVCLRRLLEKIDEAASAGVDFIQFREKDLPIRVLAGLAYEAVQLVRKYSQDKNGKPRTRLLINSRTDIALGVGADGVHLPANDLSPANVRMIWGRSGSVAARRTEPIVTISCHSVSEVAQAAVDAADFAVFAPVFQKAGARPTGLKALQAACAQKIPVIALGGVTTENAASCIEAGAKGIAGIRLFQENDIASVVARLGGRTAATPAPGFDLC